MSAAPLFNEFDEANIPAEPYPTDPPQQYKFSLWRDAAGKLIVATQQPDGTEPAEDCGVILPFRFEHIYSLPSSDIEELRKMLDSEIENRRESELQNAVDDYRLAACALAGVAGCTLDEVPERFPLVAPTPMAVRRRGPKSPVKYRGPNGETWTGRGKRPGWIRQLTAENRDIEEFRVQEV